MDLRERGSHSLGALAKINRFSRVNGGDPSCANVVYCIEQH
jgi:hypothetical protein